MPPAPAMLSLAVYWQASIRRVRAGLACWGAARGVLVRVRPLTLERLVAGRLAASGLYHSGGVPSSEEVRHSKFCMRLVDRYIRRRVIGY